jgi:hypothetical protein
MRALKISFLFICYEFNLCTLWGSRQPAGGGDLQPVILRGITVPPLSGASWRKKYLFGTFLTPGVPFLTSHPDYASETFLGSTQQSSHGNIFPDQKGDGSLDGTLDSSG